MVGIGKISDIFAGRGVGFSMHSEGNRDGLRLTLEALATLDRGLLFVNLVDFDMVYGHRNDIAGFARALVELDRWLPELEAALRPEDAVFITADHGNDPTTPGTDHTREQVPLLAFGPAIRAGPPGHTRVVRRPRTDDRRRAGRRAAAERRELPGRAARPGMKRALLAVPSLIAAKRDGRALTDPELRAIVAGAARGDIPDYQLSALLMAIVWRGMTTRELSTWTEAMIDSGERLRWDRLRAPAVDKHSTGGVGDKISLPLAPLVAVCGLTVPMIAGRALGHTGGTLDKLESIPGFRTSLTTTEIGRVLARAGFVLAGQTARLVPADRALYALRDATATVESIPLIASSILSKKVAEGARALVMDVKVGSGAFLPERVQARELARTLIALGKQLGLPVRAFLTDMDQPLGDAIGNAAEVRESIDVLRGGGPADVRALTVRLGAEMLVLGRVARDRHDGARRIEAAIGSGAGLERFRLGVRLQGGDRARDRRSAPPAARPPRTGRARGQGRRRHARRRRPARAGRDAAGRGPAAQGGPHRAGRRDPPPRQGRHRGVPRRPAGHRRIR